MTSEPIGLVCGETGVKLETGIDDGSGIGGIAGDGILQLGEVDATNYVCNRSKRVFVTSTTSNGDLSTLPGAAGATSLQAADNHCSFLATIAGLPGTYKAWLSNSSTSAASRLTHSGAAYVLVTGAVVAFDFTDLTDGSIAAPIDLTQNGVVTSETDVWTGTMASGASDGFSCTNWSSAIVNAVTGSTTATDGSWSSDQTQTCVGPRPLYCFEQ